MKRTKRASLTGKLVSLTALAAGIISLHAPAVHAATNDRAEAGAYHAVLLDENGKADAASLSALTEGLRREITPRETQVVVMIHGFNVKPEDAAKEYGRIAGRLRAQAEAAGMTVAPVGVQWASDAGSLGKWLPKAAGHRLTSLLGLKKAVKSPYLQKVCLAHRTGRDGMREVFFRLQDAFPGTPVHVLAHSLGAELVVSALSPAGMTCGTKCAAAPAVEPGRTLRLGMVTLAGADLDYDLFARKSTDSVRQALRGAQVWWVTVPDGNSADGILELRRGANRGDAVGNRGLKLEREDLDLLLQRRALVLDQGAVPAGHELKEYFNEARMKELAASMLYLQRPEAPAAQTSVLAALDRVLDADAPRLASRAGDEKPCVRLYAAWRINPAVEQLGAIRVANTTGYVPVQLHRQAGSSMTLVGMQASR